jgi:hypothetical protein
MPKHTVSQFHKTSTPHLRLVASSQMRDDMDIVRCSRCGGSNQYCPWCHGSGALGSNVAATLQATYGPSDLGEAS